MVDFKIAYLCNGLNPECSGKVGCYKCPLPINFDIEDTVCTHTANPEYAIHDISISPEDEVPDRFKRFVFNGEIRYYEEPDPI